MAQIGSFALLFALACSAYSVKVCAIRIRVPLPAKFLRPAMRR
jgi:hypothetical protein